MLVTGLYKKLADTISGLQKASSDADVWARAKEFAAEFNCEHVTALDKERLPNGGLRCSGERVPISYGSALNRVLCGQRREWNHHCPCGGLCENPPE
jgi:hypothetical protein